VQTTTLRIEGMHCDGCAERIERVLARLPGVREAAVSFAAGRAKVRHNPQLALGELVRAIERAGYRALPSEAP
jgi:copper chaperone CopZ